MINRALDFIRQMRALARVNVALARAATTSHLRAINEHIPTTWEFSGFSQNGEDGITDFLCSKLKEPNRQFVEIGAADGLENNTAWLAIAKKYTGTMIEGDSKLCHRLAKTLANFNLGVQALNCFVTKENAVDIINELPSKNPDMFSLDIDGNDYHVLKTLFENAFRPKIVIVEYNSVFGPQNKITIPYQKTFDYRKAHTSGLYYGVSIAAWKTLLAEFGYHFVTVESNGVNAFFIRMDYFDRDFIQALQPLAFVENFYQFKVFKGGWEHQFSAIQNMSFEVVV